ncbi:MAG: S9 family peptidase, partial [Nannocystaceae bacterium]|nr:S9 family peptidase [Nannocystaceae bacterium]
ACAPPNEAVSYPAGQPAKGEVSQAVAEPAETDEPAPPKAMANYFDREIDLRPFLAGFPYGSFRPSLKTDRLFYYEKGDAYTLRMLDVGGGKAPELGSGKAVSNVDWSKRSLWGIHHHVKSNTLWLHADANNDEVMNLWTLDLGSSELTQVTHHDYVYGLGFSEDDSSVAYLARKGKAAPFNTCLHLRDVASGEDRKVVCDSPALAFTWSAIRFSPSRQHVYFNAQVQGDRTRVQLVRVDLRADESKVEIITDKRVSRNSPDALDGWVDGTRLLYRANDDGFSNLYSYDAATGKTKQLTRYKEDIASAELVGEEVVAVHRTPAGSTIVRIDARTGAELSAERWPGTADVLAAHGSRAWIRQRSPDIVYEAWELDLGKPAFEAKTKIIALDPDLERSIVACKATAVKIPTFDVDKATHKTRMLHAFVLEPREPVSDDTQRLAMVTSFYGGGNSYRTFDQIMCAAGLTVVSPAVRGSSGFGKAFYSLNDKDLGGDEIVDVFRVAQWVESREGLSSRRVGVYGGSHGGYATMRALTFPPGTNGHKDVYPLGFGLSHAGFSDIKTFYDATNIPDWVVLESGDPSKPKELARMKDRSPLTHVARLRAPLLVTHGSQDWRVPVTESRQFAKAAKALGLPVQYVEFEGQGHHIEGLALQVQLYQARFDFLRAVAEAAAEAERAGTQ